MILRKFLLSPLVHFFAIGAAIFAAYALLDDTPSVQARDEITLTPRGAAQLKSQFAATWKRQPNQEELERLFHNWLLEEAYVREARKLGLDRDDPVVRQRLAMKMQFIAEAGSASLEPDDASLQAFLDANPERFAQQSQLSFDQVLLPAQPDAEQIADARAALQQGADPQAVGRTSLLPVSVPTASASAIDGLFGSGFHAALAGLPLETWAGPVESAYGQHLVRVNTRSEAKLPALAEIRPRVEAEWRATRAEEMRDAFGDALLGRYRVTLPDAAAAETR